MDCKLNLTKFLNILIFGTFLATVSSTKGHVDSASFSKSEKVVGLRQKRQVKTGQVIELNLHCPDSDTEVGWVQIIHDGDIFARAFCVNGNMTLEEESRRKLIIYFGMRKLHSIKHCHSWRHAQNGLSFSFIVGYGTGTSKSAPMFEANQQNLVCNYAQTKEVGAFIEEVTRPFFRPFDTIIEKGHDLQIPVKLEVINVAGKVLSNTKVSMSTWVRLKATITGDVHGIYPLQCWAQNSAESMYQIIRGSCGDGYVFEYNSGFEIKGNTTTSPEFNMFYLPGALDLEFVCVFALCNNCNNQNSCPYVNALSPISPPPPPEDGFNDVDTSASGEPPAS